MRVWNLLPPEIRGALDYVRHPSRRSAWGGPFNGQVLRRELFDAIVSASKFSVIIETGTHIGTTTDYMSRTGLPVYTIESDRRSFGYSRTRFLFRKSITVLYGDTRVHLARLLSELRSTSEGGPIFTYLDAHWNADLPLREELEIVFKSGKPTVAMIDDFEVADDCGYGFDDYGEGKALTMAYIESVVRTRALKVYFPTVKSAQETGARRGCVLLSNKPELLSPLVDLGALRSAAPV